MSEAFIADLCADWMQHGATVIEAVRLQKPQDYLKVTASILPKRVEADNYSDLSDDELAERIRQLDAVIRPFLDAGPKRTH